MRNEELKNQSGGRQNREWQRREQMNKGQQEQNLQNRESNSGSLPGRESNSGNLPGRESNGGSLPGRESNGGSLQYEGRSEEDRREEERKEKERQQRRRQRIEQMKREKQRREMMFRYGVPVIAALCLLLLAGGIVKAVHSREGRGNGTVNSPGTTQGTSSGSAEDGQAPQAAMQETVSAVLQQALPGSLAALNTVQPGSPEMDDAILQNITSAVGTAILKVSKPVFKAYTTENTNGFGNNIISEYGIMIDVENGEVLAQKGGWNRINPASMTKILTVLVAAEHITDLEDTFTMTVEITDYSYIHGCTSAGFAVGEEISLKDLFYGTVLPSGADAALGLAYYTAGSQEAFVDMMNEKLEELGLSETTHFTNCIGLYDENHYSTPYDMAVIMKEAADNEFCRQVLSEHYYVTAPTEEHPEGLEMSNWFLRRIEDRDTHGEVLCAKTGYVDQSKNCAASLAVDHNGRKYICVTVGSNNVWTCIRDQVELYQSYLPE